MGAVVQSPVLYVVAESLSDYKRRVAAWCEHNKVDRSVLKGRIKFTNGPVQIGSVLWTELAAWTTANGVGFIIGDTQAKMTVGSKENDNDAQGMVFAHLDELRRASGATLMLLHHTGHPGGEAGGRGRGASIWRGSVDTELMMTKAGECRATLRNDRQKVAPSGQEVGVAMVPTAQSLAVQIETTVPPSPRTQWLTGQVAAGVRFEGINKLVDAVRAAGFTVDNNVKAKLFDDYKKLVAENDRSSPTWPLAGGQTSGL
jgi:AAA domain